MSIYIYIYIYTHTHMGICSPSVGMLAHRVITPIACPSLNTLKDQVDCSVVIELSVSESSTRHGDWPLAILQAPLLASRS